MCGFIGLFRPTGLRPDDEERIAAGDGALAHRGPDGAGMWVDPARHFVVRHRLLAIRDPAHGGQPFLGRRRGTVLAYNGEIYNAEDLRTTLERAGDAFEGHGDTEIVSAQLERGGAAGCSALEGMYAFAHYDPKDRSLLLGVDPSGEKPCFVASTPDGGVLFASELRALLETGLMERKTDRVSLAFYLSLGYVPAPRTIVAQVEKIPPGAWWSYSSGGKRVGEGRTETGGASIEGPPEGRSFSDSVASVQQVVSKAVLRQCVSDRPIAVLLSGGVDSGLIAACAARQVTSRINTITMAFPGSPYDEADAARRMANHLGTSHHEITVSPRPDAFTMCVRRYMDEPIADGSFYPLAELCREARGTAAVLLGGDGGDELFLGYDGWRADWSVRGSIVGSAARLLARGTGAVWPRAWRGAARLQRLSRSESQRYAGLAAPWLDLATERCSLAPEIDAKEVAACVAEAFGESRTESREAGILAMRAWALRNSLPGALLPKSDRASMAASVELRSPLLDVHVRRLAESLPVAHLVRDDTGKAVLRAALAASAPPNHASAPKQGFRPPFAEWLRGPMREAVLSILTDPSSPLASAVSPDAARSLLELHARGPDHLHQEILLPWILALWMLEHRVALG